MLTAETYSGNALATDKHFTGQKYDSTGLHYYNARYYDDHLGTFISPDTIVPDAGHVFDYNRFMYTRGNPLKYTDPTGHSGFCDLVCSEPCVGRRTAFHRDGGARPSS